MSFNFGKCKCVHTGHWNLDVNYKIGNTVLGTTVKEKDSGVTIKSFRVEGIAASKGNKILGLIRINITYRDNKLIIYLYKAIVIPHLEYCIQTRRPYHKKDIDTLERIQRRTTKIEVFNIYIIGMKILIAICFSLQKESRTRGQEVKLVNNKCRLDIRKYSFSHRTVN